MATTSQFCFHGNNISALTITWFALPMSKKSNDNDSVPCFMLTVLPRLGTYGNNSDSARLNLLYANGEDYCEVLKEVKKLSIELDSVGWFLTDFVATKVQVFLSYGLNFGLSFQGRLGQQHGMVFVHIWQQQQGCFLVQAGV
ncbi:unnamed protein product [Vicia faba]|uniref:Uncharacterized protein n=1 Tax=Vicia faba TaxID=3906 RepID=A0AAV0YZ52_VICFA|nr:unnamed protein product [Vicia faba]